jgi:hypothetical protein
MADAIVPHRGLIITPAVAFLLQLAHEHGLTEQEVRDAIQTTGGHVMRAARHLGRSIYNSFREWADSNNNRLRREPESSQSNSQHNPNMPRDPISNAPTNPPESNGSMAGGEQQVTKPHHIWRRFPNTETAALKWIFTTILGNIPGNNTSTGDTNANPDQIPFDDSSQYAITPGSVPIVGNNTTGMGQNKPNNIIDTVSAMALDLTKPFLIQLRMTSPYNVLKTLGPNITNTNAQPQWLQYFDSKYTYYHTLETEWELSFVFKNISTDQHDAFYIFWKYTAQDDPPTTWDSSTTLKADDQGHTIAGNIIGGGGPGVSPSWLSPDDYFRMGGWHHKHHVLNSTHTNPCTIRGKYRFGQCKMDIKTLPPSDAHGADTSAEGWTAVGATPPFPENLSIVIVADNRYTLKSVTSQGKVNLGIRMETEQLIQFKDLTKDYKFPTPQLAKTSITDDRQFFFRGGGYT